MLGLVAGNRGAIGWRGKIVSNASRVESFVNGQTLDAKPAEDVAGQMAGWLAGVTAAAKAFSFRCLFAELLMASRLNQSP